MKHKMLLLLLMFMPRSCCHLLHSHFHYLAQPSTESCKTNTLRIVIIYTFWF